MGNSGQNHNMKIGNISQEKGAMFKYFGMTLTNQSTQKESKSQLNVGNVCYQFHPGSFVFFSGILNTKIKHTECWVCLLCCMGLNIGLSN